MLKRTSLVLMFAATLTLPVSVQTNTGAIHLQIEDPTTARLHAEGAITAPIRRNLGSNARGIVELEHIPRGTLGSPIGSGSLSPFCYRNSDL